MRSCSGSATWGPSMRWRLCSNCWTPIERSTGRPEGLGRAPTGPGPKRILHPCSAWQSVTATTSTSRARSTSSSHECDAGLAGAAPDGRASCWAPGAIDHRSWSTGFVPTTRGSSSPAPLRGRDVIGPRLPRGLRGPRPVRLGRHRHRGRARARPRRRSLAAAHQAVAEAPAKTRARAEPVHRDVDDRGRGGERDPRRPADGARTRRSDPRRRRRSAGPAHRRRRRSSRQIAGDVVAEDAIAILLFSGPLALSFGVETGWHGVGPRATITRRRTPASPRSTGDRLSSSTSGTSAPVRRRSPIRSRCSRPGLRPLLPPDADDVRSRTRLDPFFGAVPEGATVQLTVAGTEEIFDGASVDRGCACGLPGRRPPDAALVFSCATRQFLLGTRAGREIELAREALGEAPADRRLLLHGRDRADGSRRPDPIPQRNHGVDPARVVPADEVRDPADARARGRPRRSRAEKENRRLDRRLHRLEENVRRLEEFGTRTRRLLSRWSTSSRRSARGPSGCCSTCCRSGSSIASMQARRSSPTGTRRDRPVRRHRRVHRDLRPPGAAVLIDELNELFSGFDAICERTGVEKIKTIGDAYLVVGGLRRRGRPRGGRRRDRAPDDRAGRRARRDRRRLADADRPPQRPGRSRGDRHDASSPTTSGATR